MSGRFTRKIGPFCSFILLLFFGLNGCKKGEVTVTPELFLYQSGPDWHGYHEVLKITDSIIKPDSIHRSLTHYFCDSNWNITDSFKSKSIIKLGNNAARYGWNGNLPKLIRLALKDSCLLFESKNIMLPPPDMPQYVCYIGDSLFTINGQSV